MSNPADVNNIRGSVGVTTDHTNIDRVVKPELKNVSTDSKTGKAEHVVSNTTPVSASKVATLSNDARTNSKKEDGTYPTFQKGQVSEELDVLDKEWARQAFLISDQQLEELDAVNRYWTTANIKFTDTRLGGSIGINARPQFTRYSDIRSLGKGPGRRRVSLTDTSGNHGMGRYYSEAIDDNAQTIYMRFGVPQFNSLMTFFSKAFDPNMTALARTGRAKSFAYKVGEIVGTIATVSAFPVLSLTLITGRFLSTIFTRPTSKFYTLKPTMHMYWSAVDNLVNSIAINKGIMPRILSDLDLGNDAAGQKIGNPYVIDKDYMALLSKIMPDVFSENGRIDIFAVANRAARAANQKYENDFKALDRGTNTDFTGFVKKTYSEKIAMPPGSGLGNFIDNHLKWSYYSAENHDPKVEMDPYIDPATGLRFTNDDAGKAASEGVRGDFVSYFDAEFREGSQFAIFKVDHTGSVQEAISNSAIESDLSQKFNSVSSDSREARFSFADGNMTGSILEDTIKGAVGAAADVLQGALNGVTMNLFSGLAGLAGSGYIDIPKHWQSSNVTLPRSTYTMQLISPYGNPISQLQNIHIPLSMILAGALPLSTGSQSYASPFICQIFDRGRAQVRLGMIDSLSITRGTSALPFTNRGSVLAIDVTFSVMDFSSIMHMPISTGTLFGGNTANDEDNILMDYLAVLAGQDLYSQLYTMPKAKLALAKLISRAERLTSPAYWGSLVHEETTTGIFKYFTLGTGVMLEAAVAGNQLVPNDSR